jgi:hypothetical protein
MEVTIESKSRDIRDIASNPSLIKGIYEACDQWCMYCHATSRCLVYRCSEGLADSIDSDRADSRTLNDLATDMMFTKALADAEGRRAPPEIELMLSEGSRDAIVTALRDPLENLGRACLDVAAAYLASRSDVPFEIVYRPDGPTPLEAFAWYHSLAPARIFRAVLTAADAARGVEGRDVDTLRAAKVALLGIDRCLDALPMLVAEDNDPRLPFLQAQLTRLRTEVERRFPAARTFVRAGLDAGPVAQ